MNFLMIFVEYEKSHWLISYTTKTDGKMVKKLFLADFEGKK